MTSAYDQKGSTHDFTGRDDVAALIDAAIAYAKTGELAVPNLHTPLIPGKRTTEALIKMGVYSAHAIKENERIANALPKTGITLADIKKDTTHQVKKRAVDALIEAGDLPPDAEEIEIPAVYEASGAKYKNNPQLKTLVDIIAKNVDANVPEICADAKSPPQAIQRS